MMPQAPAAGTLSLRQVGLVQPSFAKVAAEGLFARAFYLRLFETTPHVEHMFRGDRREQERKFAAMLATAIAGLDRPQEIEPMIAALGRRHVGYGVRPGDYRTYRSALMWTLERCLGAEFTWETRQAWEAFFAFLSGTMQDAAAAATGERVPPD